MGFLRTFNLLLPALFPSWRFFDVIGPSPRVELCLLEAPEDAGKEWQECRPRPRTLGLRERTASFFWNARWNETLYLATCSERLIQGEEERCAREIRRRLRADMLAGTTGGLSGFFRYRLVFVTRDGAALRRDVLFTSPAHPVLDPAES